MMVWFISSSKTSNIARYRTSSSIIAAILTISIIIIILSLGLVWRTTILEFQQPTATEEKLIISEAAAPLITNTTIIIERQDDIGTKTAYNIRKNNDRQFIPIIEQNKVVNTRRRLSKESKALSFTAGNNIMNNEMQLKDVIRNDLNDKKSSTAIIHLGPQKTGSSSLQAFLQRYLVNDLILDNYRLVPDINYPKIGAAKSFTNCFSREKLGIRPHVDGIDYSCHDNTLSDTVKIATQYHSNLFYTSETISDHVFNETALYDFLLPYWNQIHVIGYYRRYYSWIASLHNEQNKRKNIPSRTPIAEFINNMKRIEQIYNSYYVIGAMNRFKQNPYNINTNNQNIHIYNLHNLENNINNEVSIDSIDVLEHFYCTAIPNAKNVCDKTKDILNTKRITKTNEQHDLVYIELVYYARELGYITTFTSNVGGNRLDDNEEDLQLVKDISKEAQYHHIHLLKQDKYHFSPNINDTLICPNDDAYEYILQLSLNAEKELFPKIYNEKLIRNDFQSYRTLYKFCHIDAKKVLQENYYGWKDFFINLEI